MIDPKLNEIPTTRANLRDDEEATLSDAQQAERLRRSRAGLSISDTVAGDTMLSTGSRGVDVSGVEGGAGAGSGSTAVTPGRSSSPAPNVVPGGRGTGMTPRSDSALGQSPASTARTETQLPGASGDIRASEHAGLSSDVGSDLPSDDIAARAYECWCERGCPEGSPEVDWRRAEQELRERRQRNRARGASA